ncbi:MAG: hypothetical protein AAF281_08115 [Pseudomonadota bacterium]
MFADFLTDLNSTGALPFDGGHAGLVEDTSLEPGILIVLPAGVAVKFSALDAAKPSPASRRMKLQARADPLWLPKHLLAGSLRTPTSGAS